MFGKQAAVNWNKLGRSRCVALIHDLQLCPACRDISTDTALAADRWFTVEKTTFLMH